MERGQSLYPRQRLPLRESGEVAAIWWYLAAPAERTVSGAIAVRVLDPAGGVLGSGSLPYPESGSPGWIEVPLRQPVKVHPGGVYFAAVAVPVDDRGNVHYAAVPGFGRDGRAAGPIAAWTSADLAGLGILPGNGRFAPGADAFPGQSFDDAGYGIDVSFAAGPPRPRTLHVRLDGETAATAPMARPGAPSPTPSACSGLQTRCSSATGCGARR